MDTLAIVRGGLVLEDMEGSIEEMQSSLSLYHRHDSRRGSNKYNKLLSRLDGPYREYFFAEKEIIILEVRVRHE